MKKETSATLHTTSEGERISYTYSVVDEQTGAVVSSNNRESVVLLDIPANKEILDHVKAVQNYVQERLEG